ncbi:MAG: hypothetical protein ACYTBJ_25040 [Planctomycetota bacterium]|jgi:hypothetical protein
MLAEQYKASPLERDGSIVAWGANEWGQCNVPEPNTGFTTIAVGWYHSLGLKGCRFALAGDLNDDCGVDFRDVAIVAQNWLIVVDFRDFAIVADNWLIDCETNPSSPACVPK